MRFHKQYGGWFIGCNPDMLELALSLICEDYEMGVYSLSLSFAWFYVGWRFRAKTRFLGILRPKKA